jgi:predicted ATPase with chaperone activity
VRILPFQRMTRESALCLASAGAIPRLLHLEARAAQPTPSQLEKRLKKLEGFELDFYDVRGQDMAKRAVRLAVAENHLLLMARPITVVPLSP